MVTVKDILEHFLSRANWVDREHTVDRIIVGDPEKRVDRCLVTWMPSFAALRHMVGHEIELLVCHEPTFWDHLNDRPGNVIMDTFFLSNDLQLEQVSLLLDPKPT